MLFPTGFYSATFFSNAAGSKIVHLVIQAWFLLWRLSRDHYTRKSMIATVDVNTRRWPAHLSKIATIIQCECNLLSLLRFSSLTRWLQAFCHKHSLVLSSPCIFLFTGSNKIVEDEGIENIKKKRNYADF